MAQVTAPILDSAGTAVLYVPANVCSWEKIGRAADITAKTDFDPDAT